MSKHGSPIGDNRLAALAADIKSEHAKQLVDVKAIGERAVHIGNMLIEAKAAVKHGGWLPWLTETGLGVRTAQRYMRIARHGIKSDTVTHLGINSVLKEIANGPVEFDMPDHGECFALTVGSPIDLVAFIWPARHIGNHFWTAILDLGNETLGWWDRPIPPEAIDLVLKHQAFPTDTAVTLVGEYPDDLTTWLEEIIRERNWRAHPAVTPMGSA